MNAEEIKKYQEQLQQQQAEAVRKTALLKYMSKEARERLNRIKVVRPELAEKVELALLQAVQLGQIRDAVTDVQLKNILTEVTEKKQMRILRK